MSSKPPDDDDLDGGWDVDAGWDESADDAEGGASPTDPPTHPRESAPSTEMMPEKELFRRAGATPSGRVAKKDPARKTTPPRFETGAPTDQRATMPPPVPESEYVARMMGRLPGSEGSVHIAIPKPTPAPYRAPLATIPEEDPLQFDLEDMGSQGARGLAWPPPPPPPARPDSTPAFSLDMDFPPTSPSPGHRPSSPEIETCDADLQDIDPDLLLETPVPSQGPDPELGEFDDLPVDEVLNRVSRPDTDDRASREVVIPPLRDPPAHPRDHERPTLTGEQMADPLRQVRMRFELGDYSGALVIAEGMLEEHPGHAEARRYAESCRDMVHQMYLSRLGDGSKVLCMAIAPDEVRWLTLDHRTGFLLSCIDGAITIDELLDVSGMPPLDAIRTLFELVQQGVIEVVEDPSSSPGHGDEGT